MLVEETQQKVAKQQEFVEQLERQGLDPSVAKGLPQVWEEALGRRLEIRDQMRNRARTKAMRD
jgi:hypothetical protein